MRPTLSKTDRDIIEVMGERLSLCEQCQCVILPRLLETMAVDYASGLCDVAAQQRLDGCKPLVRRLRELKRLYEATKLGTAATFDVDMANVEWCEDMFAPYFSRLYTALGAEVESARPGIEPLSKNIVCAAYACDVVVEALACLWRYITRLLKDKCGLSARPGFEDGRRFVSRPVAETQALVREFAGDCAIPFASRDAWARELCNKLLSVKDYKSYKHYEQVQEQEG